MNSWSISAEEFTERYRPSTRRPLSASMSTSLLIHGAVLAVALLWVDLDRNANRSAPAPVFDVALSRATANRDSGGNEEFVAATEAPPAEQLAVPETPPQVQVNEARPAPNFSREDNALKSAPPPAVELQSIELSPSEISQRVSDETVATSATSAWQLALATPLPEPPQPQVQRIALLASEQRMLEEQMREWQDDFELLDQPNQSVTWRQGKQIFHASVEQRAPQNSTDLERAVVEISTEVDGVRMSTQMAFKRLAFSNFAQLVDRWDRDVAVSEDEIYGRFHSNSRIVVAPERRSEPKFGGKVTVASSVLMRGFTRRADVFVGGLETRVEPIDMPEQLALSELDFNEGPDTTLSEYHFNQDGQISFLAGGGFSWKSESASLRYLCKKRCFISAGEGVELSVAGVISGTVIIVAEDTIRVTGNLIYRQHPASFANSEDYLGMLSENYIEIAPPSVTGSGDLTIHGALYAKRRFVVRNFRNRNKGLLNLFGSLTAGSLSATEPRFATRIDFDPRFEDQRPPNFPMTNKYELEEWDKQWTIETSP